MCTFTANDADSGTETLLSTLYSTPAECAYAVWTQYPSAVAATFGVIGGSGSGQCYAEFGTKTAMASSVYTFCYLPGHPWNQCEKVLIYPNLMLKTSASIDNMFLVKYVQAF